MMNFCLDGNGIFQDDNVPFHLMIWKKHDKDVTVSHQQAEIMADELWSILRKGIRDDGVPP